MSVRSFFAGIFIIFGCATATIFLVGILLSMQLQSGSGLMMAAAAIGGAIVSLALGLLLLFAQ